MKETKTQTETKTETNTKTRSQHCSHGNSNAFLKEKKSKEKKGKEMKGNEMKGKERKGKEKKGKERKRKEEERKARKEKAPDKNQPIIPKLEVEYVRHGRLLGRRCGRMFDSSYFDNLFFNKVIWTSLKSEYVPTQAVFVKLFMNIKKIQEEHTNQQ